MFELMKQLFNSEDKKKEKKIAKLKKSSKKNLHATS
jgi:hypothetical protein